MVEIVDFRSLKKKDIESQTFRERPPNRRRFSGLLRDVVAYEKRTTGIAAVKTSRLIHFLAENIFYAISKLRIPVVPCCQ